MAIPPSQLKFWHRLPSWRSLGIELWWPLPLLGITFWLGGGWLTNWVLSQPYGTMDRLQADIQLGVQTAGNVVAITAAVNLAEGRTTVRVKTIDATLQDQEMAWPVTDLNEIEALIANELGLSISEVRQVARYHILNQ